jgi:uncharacterized spore protein YtfJ
MTGSTEDETAVLETIREVVDKTTAGKVFGSPISQDGVTVLPVAKVSGGGGGGSGPGEAGHEPRGTGGGLGVSAKPLGVFVIKGGNVAWRPAVDVNKVIIGGQIVAVTALLVLRAIIKARTKAENKAENTA